MKFLKWFFALGLCLIFGLKAQGSEYRFQYKVIDFCENQKEWFEDRLKEYGWFDSATQIKPSLVQKRTDRLEQLLALKTAIAASGSDKATKNEAIFAFEDEFTRLNRGLILQDSTQMKSIEEWTLSDPEDSKKKMLVTKVDGIVRSIQFENHPMWKDVKPLTVVLKQKPECLSTYLHHRDAVKMCHKRGTPNTPFCSALEQLGSESKGAKLFEKRMPPSSPGRP